MPTVIRADISLNCLYLILDGYFGESEAKAVEASTLGEAKKLKTGFAIINDLTGFKPTIPNAGEIIKAIQVELIKMGMNRVFRVVGANAIANMQFDRRGKEAGYGSNITVEMAASVQEAEKNLRA